MPATHAVPPPAASPARLLLRLLLLAGLCALLRLQPGYQLGTAELPPLALALGMGVAAVLARGLAMVPAVLAGCLAADLLGQGLPPVLALGGALVMAVQLVLAHALMRQRADADLLMLDTWPRIRQLVLRMAPAVALVGVVGGLLLDWATGPQELAGRARLAAAVGRFIGDAAGVVVLVPVLLCWLAPRREAWRHRRRLLALPLLLLLVCMLPGFHQLAVRDEARVQSQFDREAGVRRLRALQLLGTPLDAVLTLRGVLAVDADAQDMALFNQLSTAWMGRVGGIVATGWLDRPAAGDGALLLRHVQQQAGSGSQLWPGLRPAADGRLSNAALLERVVDRALARPDAPAVLFDGTGGQPRLLVVQAVASPGRPGAAAADDPAAARRLVFVQVQPQALLAPALPDDDDPNLRVCLTMRDDPQAPAPAPAAPPASATAPFAPALSARPGETLPAAARAIDKLAGSPRCEADALDRAVHVQPFVLTLGDRRLDLVVSEPATAENRLFTAVWLLALPAVTGTAMLGALLLTITGRLRRIEDQVRERTAALQSEIDERRQAEARLAVSEQRFRAIFDSVSIGVTVVDPAGRLIEVNPAFARMMGCASADLLGRPLADFRLPDVAEDDGTAQAISGGGARRQRFLTPDGRVLQVAASLRTLTDATGQPVATVGALQDLTAVLRLREAEREREQAEVASRTKSDFLARLSHELRAPLNAILGFAQMLGSDGLADGGQQQRHGLAQIRQAGWHLLDMINDVLDLSRMEAGSLRLTLQPVSLPEVAQEALAMVEPAAQQAGVALELSLSPQAEWVQADGVRLRQVLINLLGNAVKYNHPGGRVMLRARPGAVGEVSIEIEDTGIGIPPGQMGALFTPFHRLGREGCPGLPGQPGSQGTGIGLVICKRLIELMHGRIEVTSQEGQGSVFGLTLPRAEGEPQRTEVQLSGAMPLGRQVSIGRVLYIEDNPADVQSMRTLLEQRPGITLLVAGTAAAGLAAAPEADLVLLDLDLPDRPGIEVLRALQADSRFRALPVIVVSAESRPQRIDECFDAGASQFLTKPLDAKQTLRFIDDALNG